MTDSLFDVAGQVVLVSGASRGIGEAIAMGFAARHAHVVVTGREADTVGAAAERLRVGDGTVEGLVCDIADETAINACVDDVIDRHGRIDTLVNCAGVNRRMPVEDYTAEDFDFIFNINLRGTFLMSQRVGKQMIAQKGGAQINVDSLSTNAPIHKVVPYSMSKSGMSAMTRGLAAEWGPHGVRVNALAPGFTVTDLTQQMWSDPNMRSWADVVTPAKRLATPEDMVGTALFLASKASDYITGQIIRVDGGASAALRWPITGEFTVTEV